MQHYKSKERFSLPGALVNSVDLVGFWISM
jgi:hypothetical protein